MAATATEIVSLDTVKLELRFDSTDDGSQDDMLTAQIGAAVSFVSREISRPLLDEGDDEADEVPPALRQAVILCVRQFYDGRPEIRPTAAFYALIAPWRRYA